MPEPKKIESAAAAVELEIHHVRQTYARPSGAPLLVLDDINLTLHTGEIVALLGRSGCGKSTLLRAVAGLAPPAAGEVRYHGRVVDGPPEGIAIVFQTFALFPWLTVLQNVQAGLDARGVPEKKARARALDAIELIGLDGFENAYPRELSGGMSQRVGFARALVVDPTVLLMDEPFSALDVLTGETLRSDFMDLWTAERLSIKSVLLVTHNIEEAVSMADRILILTPNPGRIAAEIDVPLSRAASASEQRVPRPCRRYLWTDDGRAQHRPLGANSRRWQVSAPVCRSCRPCELSDWPMSWPRRRSAAKPISKCSQNACILVRAISFTLQK